MNSKLSLLLATAALGAGSVSAQALFTENFDYTVGALGSNGAWGNTFNFAANTVSGSATATVVSGSITNNANPFATVGNSLSMTGSVNFNKFTAAPRIAANTNDTLFFSFMATTSATGGSTFFKFVESGINGGYNVFEFGSNASGQWQFDGAYGNGGGGTGNRVSAGSGASAFAQSASFFVVGKIVTSNTGNDQAFVQVYNNSGMVSGTDNLSVSNTLNWSVNRTDGRASNILLVNNSSALVDGIRIGNSYADVAPIPEPSSFAALAGLGALGLVGLRRRRRA